MLKLYDYFRSSAAFRVRIALNLKKLSYEAIPIHLVNNGGEQHSEKYGAINPQHLVPAMEVNGAILTQSLAIIEYLDEIHPEPALLPTDPILKAQVRAFAYAIACDIHPLNNLRVLKFLTERLKITNEQKDLWYQHWVTTGFSALEAQLAGHDHRSDFCFGPTPSLADICLVPQMFNARRFHCDITAYPNLCRIDENCQKLPAIAAAFPMETTS